LVLQQDQAAAAAVYEDFVASFAESSKQGKAWVKGETVNALDKGMVICSVVFTVWSNTLIDFPNC